MSKKYFVFEQIQVECDEDIDTPGLIFNVTKKSFDTLRKGDMVGFCNVIEYFRIKHNRADIKVYFDYNMIDKEQSCFEFYKFLCDNTNYISPIMGKFLMMDVDVWVLRVLFGDHVKINNFAERKKKICIFPVLDAKYNTFRNWTLKATQDVVSSFSTNEFSGYEKYFCSLVLPNIHYNDFKISQNFMENIKHIMECEYFVGGDTGTSHFAGALTPNPNLIYLLNKNEKDENALPLHHAIKNGKILYF